MYLEEKINGVGKDTQRGFTSRLSVIGIRVVKNMKLKYRVKTSDEKRGEGSRLMNEHENK